MEAFLIMKIPQFLAIACLCAITSHAALSPVGSSIAASSATVANADPVNYVISVTWKSPAKGTNSLQLVTCEGAFSLDTISGSVKIDDRDVPATVKLSGTLTSLGATKGRLQLFIGRTVPYVTGGHNNPGGTFSSYSQLSVGLQSTFVVTYGKPLVIQTDDNGEVVLLVKSDAK